MTPPARPADLYFTAVVSLMGAVRFIGSPRLGELLSRTAAVTAYRLLPKRRKARIQGLRVSFENKDDLDDRSIILASLTNFWRDFFLSLRPDTLERSSLCQIEGEDHLRSALDRGKGVILWESNSFGRRTLAKQFLASRGYGIVQVHIENHLGGLRNSGLDKSRWRRSVLHPILEGWEREYIDEIIYLPRDGSLSYARVLRRRLQENRIICSAADGSWGERSLTIPFLGGARKFSTGMVSLSRLTGAPLIPLFCWRESDDRYLIRLFSPLTHPSRVDRDEATRSTLTEFAKIFESCVKQHPGQYHNWQSVIIPATYGDR